MLGPSRAYVFSVSRISGPDGPKPLPSSLRGRSTVGCLVVTQVMEVRVLSPQLFSVPAWCKQHTSAPTRRSERASRSAGATWPSSETGTRHRLKSGCGPARVFGVRIPGGPFEFEPTWRRWSARLPEEQEDPVRFWGLAPVPAGVAEWYRQQAQTLRAQAHLRVRLSLPALRFAAVAEWHRHQVESLGGQPHLWVRVPLAAVHPAPSFLPVGEPSCNLGALGFDSPAALPQGSRGGCPVWAPEPGCKPGLSSRGQEVRFLTTPS